MAKTTCDGEIYIHNLSTFIQSHERQLANALVAYRKLNSKESTKEQSKLKGSDSSDTNKSNLTNSNPNSEANSNTDTTNRNTNPNSNPGANDTTANDEDNIKEISKPVRLSLSLHHLYFILGKFKDLGINVGPMNLRLDTLDSDHASNYVSFLSEFQRNKKLDTDSQSIHSISSVKSVMSSVSALWNTFGSSSKIDNSISDLKYLHSAFSKLPCLRLANEPNAKLIEGHEEYPFETATPIVLFKNILVLEISDLDPKEIYGWHLLANKLRYLVVKKTNISDPIELLVNLVEADQRVRGEGDIYDIHDDEQSEDEHITPKLSKSRSNDSDFDTFKTPLSLSSMPISHSSINLSSSYNNKVSPTLHQSHSFASSYNPHNMNNYHSFSHPHNYNHHHYLPHTNSTNNNNNYYNNNNDNYQAFSTSPTTSPSYYPNRLYPTDEMSNNNLQPSNIPPSVHSTRRSYYYKPQNKPNRRGRGFSHTHSSSVTIKSNGGESINSVESQSKLAKKSETHSRNSSVETNEKDKSESKRNSEYWKLLKHLSLTENKIEKISINSFDRLINLTSLDLSYNKLKSLPTEPLSKLVNLKSLNLSHNKLTSVQRFPNTLTKLTILNLKSNKIEALDSIEKLSNLQKIDLRQNSLVKVKDLKPLLLLNENKVILLSINLYGNPVTRSKGYRIELFNLFNGVQYNNNIKIDGSRPGIFESRLLLDEKTSRMKFKNYIDESIISKMTASVSNMNLSHILNNPASSNSSTLVNSNVESTHHDTQELITHPVLDQMSTSINKPNLSNTTLSSSNTTTANHANHKSLSNSISSTPKIVSSPTSTSFSKADKSTSRRISQSPTIRSSLNAILSRSESTTQITKDRTYEAIVVDSENTLEPPFIQTHHNGCAISTSPSIPNVRNPVAVSLRNSNDITSFDFSIAIGKSAHPSQRASNDFSATSSILTTATTTANGGNNNNDINPLSRLSLASPALPVITQATTTTMTMTNVTSNQNESGSSNVDLTPLSVSSKNDYFSLQGKHHPQKGEHEDEYSNGLKIGVI